jgi:predicted anti-sigma-YlaC factor YlaD
MSHEHRYDEVVALALDELDPPERERMVRELAECRSCRELYEGLAGAVGDVAAVTPRVEPPPGFEARALAAMGVSRRRRGVVLVGAGCAAGLVLGVAGTYVVTLRAEPAPVVRSSVDAVLRTDDGDGVGTVTSSSLKGRHVYVMTVHSAPVGMHYLCRIRLRDGSTVDAADWVTRSSSATWIIDRDPAGAVEVLLVSHNGTGPVWARARL